MLEQAFGYVRVSGQGQINGHGLERQEAAIMGYAQVHGIEVVQIFKELGVSGSLEDRPALTDLLLALDEDDTSTSCRC